MRLAGIKTAVAVSILIHIAFVSFSYSIMKRGTFHFPLPYTVTLVAPEEEGTGEGEDKEGVEMKEAAASEPEKDALKEKAVLPVKNTPAPERNYIKDRHYIEDRIAVLAGKKRVAEKVRAKKELISLSSSSPRTQKTGEKSSLSGSGNNYPQRLGAAIKRLWFFPGADGKGLEAVVSIRVLKNGVIETGGFFKKSSGNQLFDDSALRAIKKASPFAPPPYEMEIDVRFVNED